MCAAPSKQHAIGSGMHAHTQAAGIWALESRRTLSVIGKIKISQVDFHVRFPLIWKVRRVVVVVHGLVAVV